MSEPTPDSERTEDHTVLVVCGQDNGFGLSCRTCGVRAVIGHSPPTLATVNGVAQSLVHRSPEVRCDPHYRPAGGESDD